MNRLKELRKRKKMTQQELANIIGVTKLTILRWEKGDRQIKSDKAQQLAEYFNVSVGYLLGYEDNNSFVSSVVNEVDLLDPDDNTNNLNSDLKNKINLVKNLISEEQSDREEDYRKTIVKDSYNLLKGLDLDDVLTVAGIIERLYFSQYSIDENEKLEKYRDKLSKSFKK
jgi:DNA-binding helix-turn-helix protein